MKPMTAAACLLFLGSLEASAFEAWGPLSDPSIMNPNFQRNFISLPLQGQAKNPNRFWSGDYLALNKGNINYRWNAKKKEGFKLNSPSKYEVLRMSFNELAELAPTEKYDLFVGRYDYPLKREVEKIADKKAKSWEGICHGWAPATINHNEPTPKMMRNPDGVLIPFGSSDIKALISYYYSHGFQVDNTHQIGRRCDNGRFFNSNRDCKQDLNAGAFHIILTNKVGIDGDGFIADMDRFKEVWNHPINGFRSEVDKVSKPSKDSAPGTVSVIRIKTVMNYIDESKNFWDPILGTKYQEELKQKYEYDLDIDGYGNIIGGEWKSKDRPDFLWIKRRPDYFAGNLSRLGELLDD